MYAVKDVSYQKYILCTSKYVCGGQQMMTMIMSRDNVWYLILRDTILQRLLKWSVKARNINPSTMIPGMSVNRFVCFLIRFIEYTRWMKTESLYSQKMYDAKDVSYQKHILCTSKYVCGGQQVMPIERLQTKFETCFSYRESILQGCFWYVDISIKWPIFCKPYFVYFLKIITCVCWLRFHRSLFLGT